ncbi:MAG: rRNA pseudouridine synthase [Clostridia bacterium]|nr:rRNA pseudouridine synthase [Clostridia bacterium]
MLQRLDKLIASQGTRSRRDTVKLIRSGRVTIDGAVCRDPSQKVESESQQITIEGKPLVYQRFVYLMMNKPSGVLCVSRDPKVSTVVDLLPEEWKRKGLFPAGRLDKDTVGLVLLTDDGELAHRLLSPKNKIYKKYLVRLDAPLTDEHCRRFEEGITLADGTPCHPAKLEILENGEQPLAQVQITEGRYHQIKRMFGVLDRGVVWLKRVSIGELVLDPQLKEGESRPLTSQETELLVL